jgi:hypothetical protein
MAECTQHPREQARVVWNNYAVLECPLCMSQRALAQHEALMRTATRPLGIVESRGTPSWNRRQDSS